MNNEEDLRNKLAEKVEGEIKAYKTHLMSLSKEEIMLNAYELTIRECLAGHISSTVESIDDTVVIALNKAENALETLYDYYIHSDLSLTHLMYSILSDFCYDTISDNVILTERN